MTTQELNHILDLANIVSVINRVALGSFLAWFLLIELKNPFGVSNGHPSLSRIVDMHNVRRYGICLGAAIFAWTVTASVLTVGVALWRGPGLMLGFWLMLAGTFGAAASNIWILAALSTHRYGHRWWLLVMALNLIYLIIALSVG